MQMTITGEEPFDDFIELADVKDALRLSDDSDDLLVETLIKSATDYCAAYVGYPLTSSIRTYSFSDLHGSTVYFPLNGDRRTYDVLSVQVGGDDVPFEWDPSCNKLTVPDGVTGFVAKVKISPVLTGRRFLTSAAYLLITKLYEQRGDESRALTEGGWRSINALLDLAARRTV